MYHIILVEDDEQIRKSLTELLTYKGYTVTAVEGVQKFYESIKKTTYDAYLLDVILPDGSGYDICENIRDKTEAPIIFITSSDDEESVVKGLDIGGDDYITKPFHNAELLSRISSNLRRSARFKENSYSVGDIKVLFDKYKKLEYANFEIIDNYNIFPTDKDKEILKNDVELGITPTEFNIIKILIQNKGCVVKREVIYDRIWDMHGNYVEYNTLTVAVSRIKAKLGTYGEKHQAYIETIRNVGYRWIDKI